LDLFFRFSLPLAVPFLTTIWFRFFVPNGLRLLRYNQNLLYIEVEKGDEDDGVGEDNDSSSSSSSDNDDDDDDSSSSSSDDNDSTAAAHAAATGQSPKSLKKPAVPKAEKGLDDDDTASIENSSPESGKKPSSGGEEKEQATGDVKQKGKDSSTAKSPDQKRAARKKGPKKETPSKADAKPTTVAEKDKDAHPPGNESTPTPMDVDDESKPSPELKVDTGTAAVASSAEKSNGGTGDAQTSPDDKSTPTKPKKLQLNRSIYLNERDGDENTALHVAIHARKLEHVRILLEAGASCRMKSDGSWPLHTAISLGALRNNRQFAYECVVLLLEHGADIAAKDDSMHTPLFLTCMFNVPQIASYILSDEDGESTLNVRADRAGNRPLHAAAKYDTLANPSFSKAAAASVTGAHPVPHHHHPDGTVVHAMRPIPVFPEKDESDGKVPTAAEATAGVSASPQAQSTEALLTQLLLGTNGIEVDALNAMGQTPLHVACLRGNWPVARLLLEAGADVSIEDRRGYTPGQLAYKRGLFMPVDLTAVLGDPPFEPGRFPSPRDLIYDPDGPTVLLCHELCILHRTCPPIRRDAPEPPPENVRRLHVLVDPETGILRSGEFGNLVWKDKARRAAVADILKIHDYSYVESISQMTSTIPDHPSAIAHLDADTAISHWSYEAAMRAAGSVCEAVDKVVTQECRNAFCAVRPPGHHAGPRGIVRCANDPEGSHGFCLLNNVAIGAAYARCMYRNEGIQKIAIIDFDVHHGNGTEEVIRQLVPTIERATVRTPFAQGELTATQYRPWLDETDIQNVFFASTHGYGNRGMEQAGYFYPASGKTHTSEAITHPAMVENPGLSDFILSQTWARMGEDSRTNCCKIINVGLELPDGDGDPISRSMKQRLELRDAYRNNVLPNLREFDPDLIFISAGFDAHKKDTMNFGYVGMVEDDYEWLTEQIVKVANLCCNGRLVSVLEGGYKIHGGIVSPFARSVASHVRGLVDGGRSRELYDPRDCDWEGKFEHHVYDRRERKKEQEREQLRQMEQANRQNIIQQLAAQGGTPEDPDAPSRKRKRNPVDYKELFKQMQEQGFAS